MLHKAACKMSMKIAPGKQRRFLQICIYTSVLTALSGKEITVNYYSPGTKIRNKLSQNSLKSIKHIIN